MKYKLMKHEERIYVWMQPKRRVPWEPIDSFETEEEAKQIYPKAKWRGFVKREREEKYG